MDLTGWNPVDLSMPNGQLSVEWAYTGELRFTDSFFSDTLARARTAHRERQITTMDQAAAWLAGLQQASFPVRCLR